jgi:hypothetical protein
MGGWQPSADITICVRLFISYANRKIAVFVDKIPMGFAENIMLQSRGSNGNLTHFIFSIN